MEREVVRTTEMFNGVCFINFPRYRDPGSKELNLKLLDGIMCEDIVRQIPSKIRSSVTIDFSTLDYEKLLAETKDKHGIHRTMTDEELTKVNDFLIEAIF